MMVNFPGLPDGQIRQVEIPDPFFGEVFTKIDDLGELKITLHIFWRLSQTEGHIRYLRRSELAGDKYLAEGLQTAQSDLEGALHLALERGTILGADLGDETLIFINSPQGRAAIQAIKEGRWEETKDDREPIEVLQTPPNSFRLYEENIGPLTPLIADAIGEAEDDYSVEWVQDAIRIAVERNKRSWRYAEAILKRWKREGRDVREKQKDQRESEEIRRRYVEGEYSDFVEH